MPSATATPQTQRFVRFTTAWHPELRPTPTPHMECLEQVLDLATEMGLDYHARSFQQQAQSFRYCGAKQHVNADLRHSQREGLRRDRVEDDFLALDRPTTPAPHHQQAGGCVKHRGNAPLPNGDGHSHIQALCNHRANDKTGLHGEPA